MQMEGQCLPSAWWKGWHSPPVFSVLHRRACMGLGLSPHPHPQVHFWKWFSCTPVGFPLGLPGACWFLRCCQGICINLPTAGGLSCHRQGQPCHLSPLQSVGAGTARGVLLSFHGNNIGVLAATQTNQLRTFFGCQRPCQLGLDAVRTRCPHLVSGRPPADILGADEIWYFISL